jgi:hypothetical protein
MASASATVDAIVATKNTKSTLRHRSVRIVGNPRQSSTSRGSTRQARPALRARSRGRCSEASERNRNCSIPMRRSYVETISILPSNIGRKRSWRGIDCLAPRARQQARGVCMSRPARPRQSMKRARYRPAKDTCGSRATSAGTAVDTHGYRADGYARRPRAPRGCRAAGSTIDTGGITWTDTGATD